MIKVYYLVDIADDIKYSSTNYEDVVVAMKKLLKCGYEDYELVIKCKEVNENDN